MTIFTGSRLQRLSFYFLPHFPGIFGDVYWRQCFNIYWPTLCYSLIYKCCFSVPIHNIHVLWEFYNEPEALFLRGAVDPEFHETHYRRGMPICFQSIGKIVH